MFEELMFEVGLALIFAAGNNVVMKGNAITMWC